MDEVTLVGLGITMDPKEGKNGEIGKLLRRIIAIDDCADNSLVIVDGNKPTGSKGDT